MYTLRRILEDGYEHNFLLGKHYTLILKERVSEEEWDSVSKSYWGETYTDVRADRKPDERVAERDCIGFINSENETYFILPWQKNYIMIDGKTVYRFN